MLLGEGGLLACGELAPPVPARVVITPGLVLATEAGALVRFRTRVEDAAGAVLPGAFVSWQSGDPTVASVDPHGLATARAQGVTDIIASAGPVSDTARLEVYLPPGYQFEVGERYLGRHGYIEYIVGDVPIVVSAPHGGGLEPLELPDRSYGTTGRDRNTRELARAVAKAVRLRTGRQIHLIISHLHRRKLDPNREVVEAAQGHPFAEWAWSEYHGFVDKATASVAEQYGRGLYIDVHGHGHALQRLELGYLLSSTDLELPDSELSLSAFAEKSSLRELVAHSDSGLAAIVRGPSSLGSLLADRGFPAVPSARFRHPGGAPYYSGGYSTKRHGSRDDGTVSALQLEANFDGVRDSASSHEAFGDALAAALDVFFRVHFGVALAGGSHPRLAGSRRVVAVIGDGGKR